MLQFEFWLCDGQGLPTSEAHHQQDFRHAVQDAKDMLSEHPEIRKIDLICGETHVGAVGHSWMSCSCGDNICGEECPVYRVQALRD